MKKASRRHVFITVLGIMLLSLLILASLAYAAQYSTGWCNRGNILCKVGKFNEAIAIYDKAIAINPQDSSA